MPSRARQLHLGCFIYGTGAFISGWRLPGANDDNEDIEALVAIAQAAERAKFDFVFFADGLASSTDAHPSEMAKIEPLTLLAALGARTSKIGLGGTVSTTFSDPYNVARAFASIDHISHGRAAWNVVTSSSELGAANFGRPLPPHAERYRIADEYVEVVKALWDSWSDDALVRDRQSGVFVSPDKVRTIDHQGAYFSVRGPLNASRPPQGHPVILQAGSSGPGMDFAAKHADVVFTVQQDIDEARQFYSELKRRVLAAGRDPHHCHVLPGIFPVVAATKTAAQAKLDRLMTYIDPKVAMNTISVRFGHDMSKFPLDGPLPELPPSELSQSYAKVMFSLAKREGLTWRQIFNIMAVGRGYITPCGSPAEIVDLMEEWHSTQACDGFIVTPSHFPDGFDDFNNLVIPELRRRGLFREDYTGATLRAHLGLDRPANVFGRDPAAV